MQTVIDHQNQPEISAQEGCTARSEDAVKRRLFRPLFCFVFGLWLLGVELTRYVKSKMVLHRLIKLKKRYILTRSNKLRLRYSLGVGLLFAGLAVLGFSTSMSSLTYQWPHGGGVQYSNKADLKQANAAVVLKRHNFVEETESAIANLLDTRIVSKPVYPLEVVKNLEIGKGQTLAGVLQNAGVGNVDAYYIVEALKAHYSPRKVRPGQKVDVTFLEDEAGTRALREIVFKIDSLRSVFIERNDDGDTFAASLEQMETVTRSYAQVAEIETSLYGSAERAGIPAQVIANIIRVYSWNVDFQRDIRQGDVIKVLYDMTETEDGSYRKLSNISFANLSIGGKEVPIYRYTLADGDVDYFEPNGQSIRKVLMKTPVDGARLSSGFGMRKHPILGYNKMHKGVDFAAPTGTPIYAAGDGNVEYAGRKGAYGNYIRVRHNATLKTAYAHLHRLAKGIGKGTRVKQGQIIGYVGSTGRSTGPHLHYEVLEKGRQVNPNSVNLPIGKELKGKELAAFKNVVAKTKNAYASLVDEEMKLADRSHGLASKLWR